jgi:hypothetical protein
MAAGDDYYRGVCYRRTGRVFDRLSGDRRYRTVAQRFGVLARLRVVTGMVSEVGVLGGAGGRIFAHPLQDFYDFCRCHGDAVGAICTGFAGRPRFTIFSGCRVAVLGWCQIRGATAPVHRCTGLGVCCFIDSGLFHIEQLKTFTACITCLYLTLLLAGCSSALRWTPDYHTVRSGETLYSIAYKYNLDYRQLAQWNRLGDGTVIRAGQQLRLKPPSGSAASKSSSSAARKSPPPSVAAPAWRWPTKGTVYLRFGESPKTESGIRISGNAGQPVVAVAAGEVVYAGSGLASYGQLLIIKHNDSWLSAYGFNSTLLVGEKQRVSSGQQIARMGKDAAGRAVLHFEIRRNGEPVDPLRYLPRQ